MQKQISFLLALFFLVVNAFAQRDTININAGWLFATDKKAEGIQAAWFKQSLPNSRTVHLPHTWNIEPENQNHYGWAWYQKKW